MKSVFWFRKDLRLDDNPALYKAIEESDEILCIYILDDNFTSIDRWGHNRMARRKKCFLHQSIADIREQLRKAGGELSILSGKTVEVFQDIKKEYEFDRIYTSAYSTRDENRILKSVMDNYDVKAYHQHSLFIFNDDTISGFSNVFTSFRKQVEKNYSPITPLSKIKDIPFSKTSIDSRLDLQNNCDLLEKTSIPFHGGEQEAIQHMNDYIFNSENIKTYKKTRNQSLGKDYSSKFSIFLAHGCLSARRIWQKIEEYEASYTKNKSTYWLKFELLWREFFIQMAEKHGDKIFYPLGIEGEKSARKYTSKPEEFEKWKEGETGVDFIDAHMKELITTGYMSNRGRQNVASYLIYDIGEDWRKGASWYERHLIDHEPAVNTGNWLYIAGHGFNSRGGHHFNIKKQAYTYDRKSDYRNYWLDRTLNPD